MSDDKVTKLTFFSKNHIVCPVCESKFYREDLLSGGGRLIAGSLTDELRRQYEPSKKFGEVFPLVYPLTVCPECYFSAWPADFSSLTQEEINRLVNDTERRHKQAAMISETLNFSENRTLAEGICSYYMAMLSCEFFGKDKVPVFKQGLAALRAAWLCNSMHAKFPADNWDYLAQVFYRKAAYFYNRTIELEQEGQQSLDPHFNPGPDVDNNFGYDGILYLTAMLEFKYGAREEAERRKKSLLAAKTIISKIFGMGKASKDKPTVILENTKILYERINKELGGEDAGEEH
jgi:hypothetical protein